MGRDLRVLLNQLALLHADTSPQAAAAGQLPAAAVTASVDATDNKDALNDSINADNASALTASEEALGLLKRWVAREFGGADGGLPPLADAAEALAGGALSDTIDALVDGGDDGLVIAAGDAAGDAGELGVGDLGAGEMDGVLGDGGAEGTQVD